MSIYNFFIAIKNGEWHTTDELADQLGIQTSKLVEISKYLSDHGLIKYEDKTRRIKIDPIWKLLLPKQGKTTEPKTTLATFIIPPETSIDVQSTHISNVSNVELEVSLRFDNKIKEVTIKV